MLTLRGGFMKITYTGRKIELAPAQLKKLEARFANIGKLLDGKRQCEAHVVLSLERHLHHAEVTVNYYNHKLMGAGADVELFNAIHAASEKLEKQCLKALAKFRDSKRTPRAPLPEKDAVKAAEPESAAAGQIFPVEQHKKRKPMTVEEAVLEMDKSRDYLVYRNAETGNVSVLVRRRDGHFDLVET
jgi:putative sigma-54 modulation protein